MRRPSEKYIPSISSGDVSFFINITFSPHFFNFFAITEEKAIFPVITPGDAGRPVAIISYF